MFQTVLPVGFSSTRSNPKAKVSSTNQLELQASNSPSLNPFADDTIELKPNSDTVTLTHTIPLSHTPHFGGEAEDWELLHAARAGNIDGMRNAIAKGAKTNGVHGVMGTLNPLHQAMWMGHSAATDWLLQYGRVKADMKDDNGFTPLDTKLLHFLMTNAPKITNVEHMVANQNATLISQNTALTNTLAQTKESAQKEGESLNQQIEDLHILKRQRSTDLKAQIEQEREQAKQREQELKEDYDRQLAEANGARSDLKEAKEELKDAYTERLTALQESSDEKIKSLEEQLTETKTLKNQRSTDLKAQIEAEKVLARKRSAELGKQLKEAQQREVQSREDFKTQKADFTEMARGRFKAQAEENERLRHDKNALHQDLEGKLKEKDEHLDSARERSRERNGLLASFKTDKTHLQEWLLETKKALDEEKAERKRLEKAFFAKSTQAAIQRVRAEGSRSGRSQTIMISEDEPDVRAISPVERSGQSRRQSSLLDQSDAQSERSSQDNEAWATRSELSDTSRNSRDLDSQTRSSSPVYELSAEPLPLERLPRPIQERFELGLQQRERDYQDSLSSHASSASRSQSSQAKSTHSQSSAKSGTSVTSWISDGVKSVTSVLSGRDDKSSSDEGSVLSEPLKGRKGLVFKKTATRRIVEHPHPSSKLRSNASVTSLLSKKSEASDQEYFALRKPEDLASLYQEGKPERNFELFDAIYNNKKQDVERILRENPRAWKQKDKEGRNPIHWAALLGQKDTIDAVLKPLSPNTRHDLLNLRDAKGSTPIHYAAEQNQVKAADILANEYHADLSLTSNSAMSYKQNVFHIATDKGRSKLLQKLLPNAPITALNEPDVHERTPLMYAAMRGQPKLIRALLRKKGIETLKQDASHKDAFYHAVEHGVDNKNWKPVRKFLQAKYRGRVKVAFDAHDPQLEYSSFGLLAAHAPKRVVKTALKFKHFNLNQSIFKKNWAYGYKFFTPFSLAASKGHVEGMEALAEDDRVKPRALSEMQARSAYHIALDHNQPEAEKFLRTSPLIKRPIKLNKRDAKGRSPKRVGTRAGAAEAVESHLENSPGERKPFRFRKRDIEVGKMKRSDKAEALDKLAEGGKRLRLR